MARLGGTFDASQVEPNQPFDVIPAGKYKVQVVASDMRSTKDGAGQYLWLELEILEGEFAQRKLWDRLNLANSNQQAVDIAQRSLSALCHAAGKLAISDSEELHFVPVIASVRVRPPRDNYDASNEIRGYAPIDGAASVAGPVRQQPTRQAPANTASTAPWKQRKAS